MTADTPSGKTVLIAHRTAAVRDRFAVSLGDAHHQSLTVETEAAAAAIAMDAANGIDLALIDLSLAADGPAFAKALRHATATPLPLVVFAGTVTSAADIPALAMLTVGYVNEHALASEILPALSPYLFPGASNRRVSARVAVGVPISYRAGPTIAGAVTLDLAKGGLGIRTLNPLPKGTSILVKFRLPGTAGELEAAGRVAWSDRKVGMGVQFEHLSADDQGTIDAFMDAHG